MRALLLLVAFFAITQSHGLFGSEGPLEVTNLPDDWELKYKGGSGLDFYSVMVAPKGSGVLMFSKWPPGGDPKDIPATLKKLAEGFLTQARTTKQFKLARETYEIQPFKGDHCEGSSLFFSIEGGTSASAVQGMFMMNLGGVIWNGQFTGSVEDWAAAIQVLKTLKPKPH